MIVCINNTTEQHNISMLFDIEIIRKLPVEFWRSYDWQQYGALAIKGHWYTLVKYCYHVTNVNQTIY